MHFIRIPLLVTIFMGLLQASHSQGVYHQVSEQPCDVTVTLNKTVELVCSTANADFKQNPDICSIDQIIWRLRRLSDESNVFTSERLSIWESISLYGKDTEPTNFQQISILRIEHFTEGDIGRYECHVITTCDDVTVPVFFKGADLCYEDPQLNGARCALTLEEDHTCDQLFHDGRCDVECDTMATLYDGFDCAAPVPPCPTPSCGEYFMDGVCHSECNTASCLWDGGDCIRTALDLTNDALVLDHKHAHSLVFKDSGNKINRNNKQLSQRFSQIFGGLVRVISVQKPDDKAMKTAEEGAGNGAVQGVRYKEENSQMSDTVILRLDNSLCEQRCFSRSEHLARYISVYNTWLRNWDMANYLPLITVLKYHRNQCSLATKHSIHRKYQIFKTRDTISDPSSSRDREFPWINTNLLSITCFMGATLILLLLAAVVTLLICIRHEKRKHAQRKVYTSEVAKTWLFGVDV